MNLPVAEQPRPPEKPPASTRFQFATGDRPLSGYTIKRGVGRGGFGEVYFAVSDGGKEVALKLIRRNLDVELRGVQHCLNLKHPNLIALYDVRRDGDEDDCWIVMEYVAGESLEGAIRRHGQGMPADEAVAWLRGIAAGASYLHSHGIVHRDLKPGNVFREESLVKLGDYGLSKFISCSRRSGQTESVGTVHYMAPEIAHGRYGREIDIYALGVILYEMLTGRVPFDGESVGEVLMKHLTAEPDVSLLPPAYRPVVARALAKDPAVRFSSIEQFLAALPGAGPGPAEPAPKPTFATQPELPRGGNSAPRGRPPVGQDAFALFSPPVVLGTIGLVLVLMAGVRLPLVLIGFALLAGISAYASANRRARAHGGPLSSNQPWPATSDVPPPLPPMPSGRGSADPATASWMAASRLNPATAGIIGAILAGLMLPLLICFAVDFAGNFMGLADVMRPIQDGIRTASDRSRVSVLIGLALIGGFASYLVASRGTHRRSNRSADLLQPAAVGVIGAVLASLGARLLWGTAQGRPSSLAILGIILLGGFAAYSWAKNRRLQLAGNLRGPTSAGQRNAPAASTTPASPSVAYSMGRFVGGSAERAMSALVVKSPRERLIELLESLLVSAAASIVLAVIAAACQRGDSGPEEVAWFALTGMLGAWGVLALSKLWEGTRGEPILRRFAMLVVGLGLGAGSFALDRLLMVRLPFSQSLRPSRWHIDWDFYNRLDGAPHLEAYLAYFGLMFFLVPWWRQADPLRPSRVRFVSVAWTLLVALALQLVCPFPQPWGAIVAAIVSLSVQLASPPAAKNQPASRPR
ncbi:MAG TPA: serine/threonine-protein kinase [Pirellulales bacterium]|jgi:hypothetical protein|nr:serine/threonine-protein kinase [Pirellulales bacterium]